MIRRIFKAFVLNLISPDRTDFYNPGFLVVNEGRIERLSHDDPRGDFAAAEFHDLDGFALLPGFVDTHVHLPQFAIMGIGSTSLLESLDAYTYLEESRFRDADHAESIAEKFFDALIA